MFLVLKPIVLTNLFKIQVSKSNENVNAKLEKVKVLLNLSRFSINLQASDVDLLFENKIVKLKIFQLIILFKIFYK